MPEFRVFIIFLGNFSLLSTRADLKWSTEFHDKSSNNRTYESVRISQFYRVIIERGGVFYKTHTKKNTFLLFLSGVWTNIKLCFLQTYRFFLKIFDLKNSRSPSRNSRYFFSWFHWKILLLFCLGFIPWVEERISPNTVLNSVEMGVINPWKLWTSSQHSTRGILRSDVNLYPSMLSLLNFFPTTVPHFFLWANLPTEGTVNVLHNPRHSP